MKKKMFAFAIAILGLLAFTPQFNEANASPSKIEKPAVTNPFQDIPVQLSDGTTGFLDITDFVVKKRQIFAVGTLTTAAGTLTGLLIPVTGIRGTCQILELDLGPLSLDLLGLQVDLSAISLDIVAQSGPGNLLGNLLCAVANLLNGGAPNLTTLVGLLDRILGIF